MENYSNLSDKAREDFRLVLLAREGDQKAFSELMSRYRDAIFFMLLKMVSNRDDADDLTIEAFGKAFRNIHQYSPSFAFSTWLFKIATNNCIDFLRKKRAITVSIDGGTDKDNERQIILESDAKTPEETLISQQKANLLKSVVSNLKPRYRTLIELRYFQEFSYEEIADELSLPIGTVKAQLFRARELLYNIP
ncbi:MAG: sigma-70 family RNA polymerase sigma factor [Bacteroidales bacterium]|nr:sigma-70 family RNA polymerase sigma factor [Bacteroidales bacterium]MCF8454513.1 sigma-70 family RNA polymerase sigma factor [Bacteroidales bacterium]